MNMRNRNKQKIRQLQFRKNQTDRTHDREQELPITSESLSTLEPRGGRDALGVFFEARTAVLSEAWSVEGVQRERSYGD